MKYKYLIGYSLYFVLALVFKNMIDYDKIYENIKMEKRLREIRSEEDTPNHIRDEIDTCLDDIKRDNERLESGN